MGHLEAIAQALDRAELDKALDRYPGFERDLLALIEDKRAREGGTQAKAGICPRCGQRIEGER